MGGWLFVATGFERCPTATDGVSVTTAGSVVEAHPKSKMSGTARAALVLRRDIVEQAIRHSQQLPLAIALDGPPGVTRSERYSFRPLAHSHSRAALTRSEARSPVALFAEEPSCQLTTSSIVPSSSGVDFSVPP